MFKNMHGFKYCKSTSIFLFDYLFAKVKNEAMPSGNFKTESSGPCWKLEIENWKLTEIKPAKKLIEASSDTRGERRKKEREN